MASARNIPVSEIIRNKRKFEEEEEPKKKSRREWRKAKELEEARKAGTAPAAVDEEGKDINPHIPKYISSAPWYFGAKGPTLKHQRLQPKKLAMDYDAKRGRWSRYDPSEYKAVIEEYKMVEEARKRLRAEKLNSTVDGNVETEQIDKENEDKYVDEVYMIGPKVESKQRITVRNLRIREDTAKYLLNLDPNSAYYDPKSRSMRDNPHANSSSGAQGVDLRGGEAQKQLEAQLFAWQRNKEGDNINLLGEPTKVEILLRVQTVERERVMSENLRKLLDEYGGEEYLLARPF